MFRALEREEGQAKSPTVNAPPPPHALLGAPRCEHPQPAAWPPPVLEAGPGPAPLSPGIQVGVSSCPVSCLEPFASALGVGFLLSKLLLLLGFPALTVALPVHPSCHCACVLGPFPHWAAPCSPDGVSSPLSAPDSYLALWLHKP